MNTHVPSCSLLLPPPGLGQDWSRGPLRHPPARPCSQVRDNLCSGQDDKLLPSRLSTGVPVSHCEDRGLCWPVESPRAGRGRWSSRAAFTSSQRGPQAAWSPQMKDWELGVIGSLLCGQIQALPGPGRGLPPLPPA